MNFLFCLYRNIEINSSEIVCGDATLVLGANQEILPGSIKTVYEYGDNISVGCVKGFDWKSKIKINKVDCLITGTWSTINDLCEGIPPLIIKVLTIVFRMIWLNVLKKKLFFL